MTNLIPHTINSSVINQRSSDGFISATAMCNAADKLLADYRRLSSTNEYLCALSNDMGNPITDLIQIKRGGRPAEQGTWVHPKVALHLAQWLSPEFAVQVTNWVYDWMTGQAPVAVRAHTRKKPVKKPEHTKTPIERWDEAQSYHRAKQNNIRAELRELIRSTLAESKRLTPLSLTWGEAGATFPKAERLMTEASIQAFGNNNEEALRNLYEAASLYRDTLKSLEGKALIPWH
ncbi:KilA-N domain-containing protein [Kiloniella litopenaei]|uniref:KilA-N domain-containing protein n=1 Tax=Kiloniella litopenaei TaxID=1549748 RepID=UPI000697F277|nr:KilA-N domain-containing protein [Kiloniella litopenaei]